MSSELIAYSEIEKMARAIAASNFFGVKTPEQAVALMLIAQAEGMHPAAAARDYNVIQGRPALKADAMLARFQGAGGSVKWEVLTDEKVSATFTHAQGGSVTIDWDMDRAKAAGLSSKDNYRKWPRQMLRARVISEGIRTVYPGVLSGMYTPEEVVDFDDKAASNGSRPAKIPAAPIEDAKVVDEPKPELPPAPQPSGNNRDKVEFLKKCDSAYRWLEKHKVPADVYSSVLGSLGFEKPEQVSDPATMAKITEEYSRIMREIMMAGTHKIPKEAA